MTSISVADCMVDRGYLAEFCNVNYKNLPLQNERPEITTEKSDEKYNEEKKSKEEPHKEIARTSSLPSEISKNKDSEDELRSRIFGLTKELNDMKQFMAEKMQKQVKTEQFSKLY